MGNEIFFSIFFFDLKRHVYPLSRFIDSSTNLQTSFGDSPDFPVEP